MLRQLRVENYAVIDQVTVDFQPGLNLLTGETGAGKSILIDALALLLGEKASSDAIRHGAERAVLSCVFDLEPASSAAKHVAVLLEENGIDTESDELIIRREISTTGKGRVFVNNQPATVTVLKLLAAELASIHAQNETIIAFDARARLQLLDAYAGIALDEIEQSFGAVRTLRNKISELEQGEQDRLRLLDLWKFQSKEIADSRLEAGEDTKLETEKRVLANSEKLHAAAHSAYETLYDGSVSAASLLRNAERSVEELAKCDEKFQEQLAQLSQARALVEDASATVRNYADHLDASPERLAAVEDRLALLDKLKRKYGASIEEVMAFGEDAARKLNEVENRDEMLAALRKELRSASSAYLAIALAASKKRKDAAKRLEGIVESEINDLAMKSKFNIVVASSESEAAWSSSGMDAVTYMIATNPGEPQKPIEQIASGGELSRVMLALKASVEEGKSAGGKKAKSRHQRALVFDEIDTGIGGRAAEAVGKRLKSLARNNQVLCITHLPQIASFADHHFVIEKRETSGRSATNIRLLSDKQRTEEVARMLSGAKLTETSLRHAEQMLKANASA